MLYISNFPWNKKKKKQTHQYLVRNVLTRTIQFRIQSKRGAWCRALQPVNYDQKWDSKESASLLPWDFLPHDLLSLHAPLLHLSHQTGSLSNLVIILLSILKLTPTIWNSNLDFKKKKKRKMHFISTFQTMEWFFDRYQHSTEGKTENFFAVSHYLLPFE